MKKIVMIYKDEEMELKMEKEVNEFSQVANALYSFHQQLDFLDVTASVSKIDKSDPNQITVYFTNLLDLAKVVWNDE